VSLLKFVVSNQRGGVGKTTTATTLARCFADKGMKTLLIDTDSQGSIQQILGLKPEYALYDFLIGQIALKTCIVAPHPMMDVLCSDRRTMEAEDVITSRMGREMTFEQAFGPHEAGYDAIIIDVAPSLNLFQTCAMMYTRNVLIPAAMDSLSATGAASNFQAMDTINRMFKVHPPIRSIGLLPVIVDRRLQMTDLVLETLEGLSARTETPVFTVVRTDTAVVKAGRQRMFLADYDQKSKALEDYNKVADQLIESVAAMTKERAVDSSL
jgi:chromosome partitioning protein